MSHEAVTFLLQILAAALVASGAVFLLRKRNRKRFALEVGRASEPYGAPLASAVADRLERGDVLSYGHRDYCGMGIRFADGRYIYGEVADGELPSELELSKWTDVPTNWERLVFHSRSEFVGWLARQSNDTLSGKELRDQWLIGNQRITRQRLESFARGEQIPWS